MNEKELIKDKYSVHEITELFRIGEDVVRHAVFNNELKAEKLGHDILFVKRENLLTWLKKQGK